MNFEAFKNYYEAMISLEPDKIKKAFFNNIRRSFAPDSKALLSAILSLAALVCLAVVATAGLTLAAICLVIAVFSGCNPRSASNSKSIFLDGIFVGGLFGIPCLIGTIIQGFTLPFQIVALPFMLIVAAGLRCYSCMSEQPDLFKAESLIINDPQLNQTSSYLLRQFPRSSITNESLQNDGNADSDTAAFEINNQQEYNNTSEVKVTLTASKTF